MNQSVIDKFAVELTSLAPADLIQHKIKHTGREYPEDAFCIVDLGDVAKQFKLWNSQLPCVQPFYAVKCNPDPAIVAMLAHMGAGFDCASKVEISQVLSLGVATTDIVYANPCKQVGHITFAAANNVNMMTFDNEDELQKIKRHYPDAKLLLRFLHPVNDKCRIALGDKYGAPLESMPRLIDVARKLELNVIGFHVGSGTYDPEAYVAAIAQAKEVFNLGQKAGYSFHLLDIGGGFPGNKIVSVTFEDICAVVRPAIDKHFPTSMGIQVIGEPGRLMVESAVTLVVNIIGKRVTQSKSREKHTDHMEPNIMYYINDGIFGSFPLHPVTEPPNIVHEETVADRPLIRSIVWGPTLTSEDVVKTSCLLPELEVGSWLYFRNMGAYTMSTATHFNGMSAPHIYYVMRDISI